jgi:hypothetical protein
VELHDFASPAHVILQQLSILLFNFLLASFGESLMVGKQIAEGTLGPESDGRSTDRALSVNVIGPRLT